MNLREMMPKTWRDVLSMEFDKPYIADLEAFLNRAYDEGPVYPPKHEIFSAFELTPFDKVKVLIIGQDPYHGPGEAHGLSFSVKPGVRIPPSLRNIYKELHTDMGIAPSNNGHLIPWAEQGVLMLNAVLTVKHKTANAHQKKGWEKLTTAAVQALGRRQKPLVAILWGAKAKKNARHLQGGAHRILESAHPSPLSAYNGFWDSRPFSQTNDQLCDWGDTPINWQIPAL